MNFFYCDDSLATCAQNLDDRRVTKMVLETAQLLNNCLVHHGDTTAPYRPTHMNHPSSVWCRTSPSNYQLMLNYFAYLCREFELRRGKEHKCAEHYHTFVMFQWDLQLDDWDKSYGTPIPNCTDYKNVSSTIKAYRLHLRDKWDVEYKAHEAGNWYQPVWTGRDMPEWYTYIPLRHIAADMPIFITETDRQTLKEINSPLTGITG